MHGAILLAFAFVFTAAFVNGDSSQACTTIDPCSCSFGNGKMIDISPLAGEGGKARFSNIKDPSSSFTYSYNPCKSFSQGGCADVAICQTDGKGYFDCGNQNSATFVSLSSVAGTQMVQIDYSATGNDGKKRKSTVNCICDPTGPDQLAVDNSGYLFYMFDMKSKYCCPVDEPSGGGSSLSTGSVLLIVFFVLVIVYFVAGALYLVFVRKNSGTNAVPNKDFWTAIPGLVKDGTLFVVRRGRGAEYNKI